MCSTTPLATGAAAAPLFDLGPVYGTPGALDALRQADTLGQALIYRHVSGDFGDLGEEDRAANQRAIVEGTRVFSAYRLVTGVKVWVITEADRSSTTVLLPSEY